MPNTACPLRAVRRAMSCGKIELLSSRRTACPSIGLRARRMLAIFAGSRSTGLCHLVAQ